MTKPLDYRYFSIKVGSNSIPTLEREDVLNHRLCVGSIRSNLIIMTQSLFLIALTAALTFLNLYCGAAGAETIPESEQEGVCELWLGPSTIKGVPGKGVITGVNLTSEYPLEPLVTLSVPYEIVRPWSLANYVFAHEEEDQALVVFGIGMLINHKEPPSLYHYWAEDDPSHSSESYWTPSTMSSSVIYETLKDIKKGEELFISYGGDEWFQDRSIPVIKDGDGDGEAEGNGDVTKPPVLVPDTYLRQHGHCLTDVFISESAKPMTFYGLFARRLFKKGEIVTISPLLALPADEVRLVGDQSLLMNYCVSSPGSKVAMLPIGYAAMINHDGNPSVRMDWHTWSGFPSFDAVNASDRNSRRDSEGASTGSSRPLTGEEELQRVLESDPAGLIYEANHSLMDLKFVALRDIQPEEEITMDYGTAWINQWAEYMSTSMDYHINKEASVDYKVIFRAFIDAPKGLFPERWTYFEEPEVYERSEELTDEGFHLNDARAALEGLTDFYSSRTGEEL
jgi:hypothetical protein